MSELIGFTGARWYLVEFDEMNSRFTQASIVRKPLVLQRERIQGDILDRAIIAFKFIVPMLEDELEVV